ncbi:MAG: signal transduction protein [Pseudomonadota bacterium]
MPSKKRSIANGGFAIVAVGALIPLVQLSAPPAFAQSKEDIDKLVKQADQNGDGSITWSEVIALRETMFGRMDRNEDGYVDQSDRPFFYRSQFDEALERMGQFDADGDERVSRQELIGGKAPVFEQADINKDQVLSAAEIEAIRASQ